MARMARIPEDEPLYTALRERLVANGLPRVVDDLLALAQPAIRLDLTRVAEEALIPPGASKVGGEPNLPAGTAWPATQSGMPLPFIAQIRLADIAPYDPEGDLPHEGLLSFFYAMNDAEGEFRIEDDPTAWRVIWTRDEGASLFRFSTPAALADMLDAHFLACAVTFARRLTLPGSEAQVIKRLGFTNDERLGYINVTTGSDVGFLPEMDMRLLGYPYELEPTTFEEAYRAAHGIPWSVSGPVVEANAEMDRKVNEEWRLLLQVYSNEEAEMDWAGGGVIHFGIRRDALAARDFSQVWVSLQSL